MPQLMPMYWVFSSFLYLLVLMLGVLIFSLLGGSDYSGEEECKKINLIQKWLW